MSGLRLIALLALAFSFARLSPGANPALAEPYRKWLNEDVVYIITDEERKAFLHLANSAERDHFIEEFWAVRGGSRFKEEHYRRIEYANRTCARHSTGPGWRTDMGRTWILFGKPVSRHEFTGYGQIYPLELWSYENTTGSPSLPPFFDLLFYIPEDIGEYKYYRPYIDGPMKLVRGSNFNTNADVYRFLKPLGGDVAHAAFSLVPNDPIDTSTFQPDLSGDMLVSRIQNFANDPSNVNRIREMRSLRAVVKSYVVVEQDLPLKTSAIVLADPEGQYWLDYAILVDDARYGALDAKNSTFSATFRYRLLTESGQLVAEDSEDRTYACRVAAGSFCPVTVTNRLPLAAGSYRLELEVVNSGNGHRFRGSRVVRAGGSGDVVISGPLLASGVQPTRQPDARVPFQYFGVQFRPAVEGAVPSASDLRLLFELDQPPEKAKALRVEYVLGDIHNREVRKGVAETVEAKEFANGRLLRSKTLPLAGLEDGEYRLAINIRGVDSERALASANSILRIRADEQAPALVALENSKATATRAMANYIRGLATMAQGSPAAAGYLRSALDANPKNGFAAQYLVQVYFGERQYKPVIDVYDRFGVALFESSPESLAQISASLWATGDRDRANELLDRAKRLYPGNPAIATAAAIARSERR